MGVTPTAGPSDGFFARDEDLYLVAHRAFVAGDVAEIDYTAAVDPGTFAPTQTVDVTDTDFGFFVVAQNAILSGARGHFKIRFGRDLVHTDATILAGDGLEAVAGEEHLIATAGLGVKVVAKVLFPAGAASATRPFVAADFAIVDFEGQYSLGIPNVGT